MMVVGGGGNREKKIGEYPMVENRNKEINYSNEDI
jgi:hypothetical protein